MQPAGAAEKRLLFRIVFNNEFLQLQRVPASLPFTGGTRVLFSAHAKR
jgi:hypothetical protein